MQKLKKLVEEYKRKGPNQDAFIKINDKWTILLGFRCGRQDDAGDFVHKLRINIENDILQMRFGANVRYGEDSSTVFSNHADRQMLI